MAKYRIVKVTKFNNDVSYIIQKKGLFRWHQAYYDNAPWTYRAITSDMNSALEILATKFNVHKTWEVVYEGKSIK